MGLRAHVADLITTGLTATGIPAGEYTMSPHMPVSLDAITVPAGWVRIASMTPGAIPGAWYDATIVVTLAVPQTEPGPADDALDDWLMDVLACLRVDDTAGVRWQTATRAVLDDSWPAYEITCTATATVD